MTTSRMSRAAVACAIALAAVGTGQTANAAGEAIEIARQNWSFSGLRGQYDKAQLQRGFQIYKDVCSSCHGLARVSWRNLVEPGGPEFPEEAVKALAADWPNKITDGPNDDGEMFERAPGLPDRILGPYKNENAARAAQNGAYPLDLSLIARARNPEYTGSVFGHPTHMLGDILGGYQEGGVDYLYALLTGYTDLPVFVRTPEGRLIPQGKGGATGGATESCVAVTKFDDGKPDECVQLADGMSYNAAFAGHQIAMPAILADGAVSYIKGPDGKPQVPETLDQHARDVAAFLAWAAEPHLNQRKATGWQVMLYLLITTLLLYLSKKRIWSRIKH